MQNIIFLDIDGVISTDACQRAKKKFWYDEHTYPFDTYCVKAFNMVLQRTGAQIVLSSSWRLFYTLEQLAAIFEWNGVAAVPIAITEDLGDRSLEIATFITENKVSNFLILDDFDITCHTSRFFQTKVASGLLMSDLERVLAVWEG
jgi:HAD domain in Swiss Army Knife RNA repair proteins